MTAVYGDPGPRPVVRPKAGAFGIFSIVFYGIVCVIAVFVATYFYLDSDGTLAAALGLASLAIPVTAGFFIAELRHQRAGALAFVLVAAIVAGGAAAAAWYERDDYLERRELFIGPTDDGVPALDGLIDDAFDAMPGQD